MPFNLPPPPRHTVHADDVALDAERAAVYVDPLDILDVALDALNAKAPDDARAWYSPDIRAVLIKTGGWGNASVDLPCGKKSARLRLPEGGVPEDVAVFAVSVMAAVRAAGGGL